MAELSSRRPLVRDDAELSQLARKELDIVAAAAAGRAHPLGAEAVPTYIISMQIRLGHVGGALLLKEAGLLDLSGEEPYAPVGIVPLFETIEDLSTVRRSCRPPSTSRCTGPWWLPAATPRR